MNEERAEHQALDRAIVDAVFLTLQNSGQAELPFLGRFTLTERSLRFTPNSRLVTRLPEPHRHSQPAVVLPLLAQLLAELSSIEAVEVLVEPTRVRLIGESGSQTLAIYPERLGELLIATLLSPAGQQLSRQAGLKLSWQAWPAHRPQLLTASLPAGQPTSYDLLPTGQQLWRQLEPTLSQSLVIISGPAPARQAAKRLVTDIYRKRGFAPRQLSYQEPELHLLDHAGSDGQLLLWPGSLSPAELPIIARLQQANRPLLAESRPVRDGHWQRLWQRLPELARLRQQVPLTTLQVELLPKQCTECSHPDHLVSRKLLDAIQAMPPGLSERFRLDRPQLKRNRGCQTCAARPNNWLAVSVTSTLPAAEPWLSLPHQRLIAICHGQVPSSAYSS